MSTDPLDNGAEKVRLESEKLRAEIESIRRPLLKTPSFYGAMAPVALGVLGLVFTWWSGWFDVQRTRIANEKTLLLAETEGLRMDRTRLASEAEAQGAKLANAESSGTRLQKAVDELSAQQAHLTRKRAELQDALNLMEAQSKRLAGADSKAAEYLDQLKTFQASRAKLEDELNALRNRNGEFRQVIAGQATLIQKANTLLTYAWSLSLADKSTWNRFKDFNDLAGLIHGESMSYLPKEEAIFWLRRRTSDRVFTYDDDRAMAKDLTRDIARRAQTQLVKSTHDSRWLNVNLDDVVPQPQPAEMK